MPRMRLRQGGVRLVLTWLLCLLTGNTSAQVRDVTLPHAYSDLSARSATLTPDQKAQAAQLFSTGFTLWQSGNFSAASLAFKQGLDIDPANTQANYYYGDSLLNSKDRKGATEYMSRAVALGNGLPESFMAKAALEKLSKPTPASEMTADELREALVGTWGKKGPGLHFSIRKDASGALVIEGETCAIFCSDLQELSVEGSTIRFNTGSTLSFEFHLIDPNSMDGVSRALGNTYPGGVLRKAVDNSRATEK